MVVGEALKRHRIVAALSAASRGGQIDLKSLGIHLNQEPAEPHHPCLLLRSTEEWKALFGWKSCPLPSFIHAEDQQVSTLHNPDSVAPLILIQLVTPS